MNTMLKPILIVLVASSLAVYAETEDQVSKRFTVPANGKLIVEVDFGSIDVKPSASNEVTVDVQRKVTRGSKAEEEAFLRDRPVTFSQDGGTVTVSSHSSNKVRNWWHGSQKTEARYTITVPAAFAALLKTAGGGVSVDELSGGVKAETSGGPLRFSRLQGSLDGRTSGGGIRVLDCEGKLLVRTSGGKIEIDGGTGEVNGETSGGSVTVKNFHGPAHVGTNGGNIQVDNVSGAVEGSTSGGSISARFSEPPLGQVKLSTSGGGVTLVVPESSAFDLDAATSGGSVHSEIPVAVTGKVQSSHLRGPVNGGGKAVVLRTSGGSIYVKKS